MDIQQSFMQMPPFGYDMPGMGPPIQTQPQPPHQQQQPYTPPPPPPPASTVSMSNYTSRESGSVPPPPSFNQTNMGQTQVADGAAPPPQSTTAQQPTYPSPPTTTMNYNDSEEPPKVGQSQPPAYQGSEALFSVDNMLYHAYGASMGLGSEVVETQPVQQTETKGARASATQQKAAMGGFGQSRQQDPAMGAFSSTGTSQQILGGVMPFGHIQLPQAIESRDVIRFTVGSVTGKDTQTSNIPLCALVQPMASHSVSRSSDDSPTAGIIHRIPRIRHDPIRCTHCLAYINCYSMAAPETKRSNGSTWQCLICGTSNAIPKDYQDRAALIAERSVTTGLPADERTKLIYSQFPELIHNNYECVLTRGYITRTPLPPLVAFVLDINNLAGHEEIITQLEATRSVIVELAQLSRGITSVYSGAVRKSLKVALITYDTNVHMFSFGEGDEEGEKEGRAKEYVLNSKLDRFPPVQTSKFVADLTSQEDVVLSAIDKLIAKFSSDSRKCNTTLGTAIKVLEAIEVATKLIKATPDSIKSEKEVPNVCGRIVHFNHSLETLGRGAITRKVREKVNDDTVIDDLRCQNNNWKELAIMASESSVVIDSYIISTQPTPFRGVAEQSVLSEYTGGVLEFYPSFNRPRDSEGIRKDLKESLLSRDYVYDCGSTGQNEGVDPKTVESEVQIIPGIVKHLVPSYAYDCAVRLRASSIPTGSITIEKYYGAFELSGTELVIAAGMDRNSTVMVELSANVLNVAYLQMCLLYTDTLGNRIMRVSTTPLYAGDIKALYGSLDTGALVTSLAKNVAKHLANNKKVEGTSKAKAGNMVGPQKAVGNLVESVAKIVSTSMGVNGAIPNNVSLFGVYTMGLARSKLLKSANMDEESFFLNTVRRMSIDTVTSLLYPKMYRADDMSQQRLSLRKLDPTKIHVLEDLYCIYVFSGDQADVELERQYFGNDTEFPPLRQEAPNISEILAKIRRARGRHLPVFCVPKKSRLQGYMRSLMIEDVGELTNEEWNKRLNSVVASL